MSDEQKLRSLLVDATNLPDSVQPPVQQLLRLGRRRHHIRSGLRIAAAAAVVVAAFAAPPMIRIASQGPTGPSTHLGPSLFGNVPLPEQSGPTAAQLAKFRWSTLPPSPFGNHATPLVAWAGDELFDLVPSNLTDNSTLRGAAFSPATGRWRAIASVKFEPGGYGSNPTAWTGRELFIAGGQFRCTGRTVASCRYPAVLYDPATNHWTMTRMPAQMTSFAAEAAVWTGRYIVVAASGIDGGGLAVAAYDPATGRWHMITPRLPHGHSTWFVSMIATSDRLILWSQWRQVRHTAAGVTHSSGVDVLASSRLGSWDNVTGNWPAQAIYSLAFTDRGILVSPATVWCGPNCNGATVPGYFADPVTLHRTVIPPDKLGLGTTYDWTGRAAIAFDINTDQCSAVGPPSDFGKQCPSNVAAYDPATGTWHRLPGPPDRSGVLAEPVWTGSELLVMTSSGRFLAFGP